MEQRELRFRAWDIDSSTMLTDFENPHNDFYIGFDKNAMCLFMHVEEDYPEKRQAHIMQYTCRQDKNRKEIWEGDIVKRIHKTINDEKFINEDKDPYDYETQISVVEFRGAGFWVKSEDFGWEGEDLWDWDTMEVIGNIYENPELIKQ